MRLEEDLVIRRSRPTMISAKYRAREERRRLLKISAGKLRRIEDPETSLCRSVLINNAVRRLQSESKDDKPRNYGLPVASYLHDTAKENNISRNLLIDVTDNDASSRKRLNEDVRNESLKRQRVDDLALQDDVFSDFYIIPSTPRLLSHFDNMTDSQSSEYRPLGFHESRLSSTETLNHSPSGDNDFFASTLNSTQRTNDVNMMEVNDVDSDRICDYTRFTDSTKTLEERLVELQTLDEHFDLTKFERNNSQSCGRAFHDIQTFHSLVPGLET